jgi:hypothetical protein
VSPEGSGDAVYGYFFTEFVAASGRGERWTTPPIGARVVSCRSGIERAGTVQYSDPLQVLVKWDDGSSSSLPTRLARRQLLGDRPAAFYPPDEAQGNSVGFR